MIRFPIGSILEATHEYLQATRRRVSFEYVLLKGTNDSARLARELGRGPATAFKWQSCTHTCVPSTSTITFHSCPCVRIVCVTTPVSETDDPTSNGGS